MGILSDRDIRYMLEPAGGLVIEPRPEILQPTSVDLHLGDRYMRPVGGQVIDPMKGIVSALIEAPFKKLWLYPGDFVLGCTQEWIGLPPNLVGILMGKSTLARFGLQIESAGYVDPGWKGRLTLEIVNLSRDTIVLRPGMQICQIRFEGLQVNGCENLYGSEVLKSHYQGSLGPQPGRLADPVPEVKLDLSAYGTQFSELDPG